MLNWREMESRPTSDDGVELRAEREPPSTRQEELRSFLFFTIVMAPVLAVVIVAGYGFFVWMAQLLFGPPAS
jgi:periplasmic nitrate reductase NapE